MDVFSRELASDLAEGLAHDDLLRSMAMELVCDVDGTASALGHFDGLLLVRFKIPVRMWELRVRLDLGDCERPSFRSAIWCTGATVGESHCYIRHSELLEVLKRQVARFLAGSTCRLSLR